MTIRTISNLPAISADELTPDCLFATSEPVAQDDSELYKYISKKVTFGDFSEKVAENVEAQLSDLYGLYPGMYVSKMQDRILSVYTGDISPTGNWTFKKQPYYKESPIATQEYV